MLGILVGGTLGYAFSKLMRYLQTKRFIGEESFVVQFVALVLFIEGVVSLMGSDDLLASFAAGACSFLLCPVKLRCCVISSCFEYVPLHRECDIVGWSLQSAD